MRSMSSFLSEATLYEVSTKHIKDPEERRTAFVDNVKRHTNIMAARSVASWRDSQQASAQARKSKRAADTHFKASKHYKDLANDPTMKRSRKPLQNRSDQEMALTRQSEKDEEKHIAASRKAEKKEASADDRKWTYYHMARHLDPKDDGWKGPGYKFPRYLSGGDKTEAERKKILANPKRRSFPSWKEEQYEREDKARERRKAKRAKAAK